MTVLGHDSTVPATMDEMIVLTRAVNRGARRPLVVADMPFGSFQVSDEDALENAIRFLKEASADAVKVEGAGATLSRVSARSWGPACRRWATSASPRSRRRCSAASRPRAGPRRRRGASSRTRSRSRPPACSPSSSRRFRLLSPRGSPSSLAIPTIGIGAGVDCDGQVLVWHDLLGLYEGGSPRFVKQYADLASEITKAVSAYVADVRERRFPEEQHTYSMPEDELALFEASLEDAGKVGERR